MSGEETKVREVPIAVELSGVTVEFFGARHFTEFLVSMPWFKKIFMFVAGLVPDAIAELAEQDKQVIRNCPLYRFAMLARQATKRKKVLDNVEIIIPQGSIYGIFGINGAGKSTALHLISGLLSPEAGEVKIYGEDRSLKPLQAKQVISKAICDEIYKHVTADELMEFTAHLYRLDKDEATKTARDLLKRLGLSEDVQRKERIDVLSVGNRGKVAIVRGLLPILRNLDEGDTRGPILLLDEPSRGLDVLAVEAFFKALEEIRTLIPTLTIIIATNDLREAGLCTAYTAISKGRKLEQTETIAMLSKVVKDVRVGTEHFAKMIGGQIEGVNHQPSGEGAFELHRIKPAKKYSVLRAFWSRSIRDTFSSLGLIFWIVMGLVVPNLLPLFAAAPDGAQRGLWPQFVMASFGIYSSIMIREAYRFLERERSWFRMIEIVMSAPISRFMHWFANAVPSFIVQITTALFSIGALAIVLSFTPGFREIAVHEIFALDAQTIVQLIAIVACCTLSFFAIGSVASLVPFTMHSNHQHFLLMLLPMFMIVTSGVFYDPEILPGPLWVIANVNPMTYGAHAMRELLHFQAGLGLPAAKLLSQEIPRLQSYGADMAVLVSLTAVYLFVGIFTFRLGVKKLTKLGRFRGNMD